jgi:hypothetical protein
MGAATGGVVLGVSADIFEGAMVPGGEGDAGLLLGIADGARLVEFTIT